MRKEHFTFWETLAEGLEPLAAIRRMPIGCPLTGAVMEVARAELKDRGVRILPLRPVLIVAIGCCPLFLGLFAHRMLTATEAVPKPADMVVLSVMLLAALLSMDVVGAAHPLVRKGYSRVLAAIMFVPGPAFYMAGFGFDLSVGLQFIVAAAALAPVWLRLLADPGMSRAAEARQALLQEMERDPAAWSDVAETVRMLHLKVWNGALSGLPWTRIDPRRLGVKMSDLARRTWIAATPALPEPAPETQFETAA